MPFEPVGAWTEWAGHTAPTALGELASYHLCAGYLDGLPVVEDWGAGTGYARTFFHRSHYVAVDGSPSKWIDVVADIAKRRTRPSGIMMRHVLEHNPNWQFVLANALRSFENRMAICFHVPLVIGAETSRIDPNNGIPTIWINRADFLAALSPFPFQEIHVAGSPESVFFVTHVTY